MPDQPPRRDWRLAGIIFFSVIALLVLWATFHILRPFVTPIVLAAVLVTLTFNWFERVRARLRGSSPAAAVVMLLGITFLLALPLFILVILLVREASGLVESIQTGHAQQLLARIDLAGRLEFVHRWIPQFDPATLSLQRIALPVIRAIPGWVARNGTAIVGGAAGMIIQFLLTLLACYFFFVEGEGIMRELEILSPLPEEYDRAFALQFKDVVDATFRGYVATGIVQGLVTMVGLVIAGVPAAFFWGSVATVISLLPFVGAAIVWVPAAIYLYANAAMGQAAYWQAIFLTIWGAVIVTLVEHIVRPWVMKGKSQLPAIPLLFAVLGGMEAFGFIGLVIGPLVFSLLMTIIDIYKKTFQMPRSESSVA